MDSMSSQICCSRRRILQAASAGAVLSTAAVTSGCSSEEESQQATWRDVIALDELNSTEPVTVSVDEHPLLVRLLDESSSDSATQVQVLSGVCPHQGCSVGVGEDIFECPCHGSQFQFDGVRIAGPAQDNLSEVESRVEDAMVQARLYETD